MAVVLMSLLHLLVFAYWLGGDIGAFYASGILTDKRVPPAGRAVAARVLSNIDMAPRSALILAGPTGLGLAVVKGWLSVPPAAMAAIWAGCALWLVLVWRAHLLHTTASTPAGQVERLIRFLALGLCAAAGLAILTGALQAPLFIGLKLLVLATAIGAGLFIRVLLKPFGSSLSPILAGRGTAADEAAIAVSLARARPLVLFIWACLLLAALLGLWTPQ